MVKKKVLFTGGSGLLAINWAFAIAEEFEVVLGLHDRKISVPGIQTVFVKMETVNDFSMSLDMIRPDVVIHCAGLANVEVCEADPVNALYINGTLSENVARACREKGIQLVYICTDHLFTGKKAFVSEDEPVSPVNEYGATKLNGEKRILAVSETFLSIRTNFYGWGPLYRRSFSDMIIDNLSKGNSVSLFEDFFYTPVLIEELAQIVMQLIEKNAGGIFNVAGKERISKYEFGVKLAHQFDFDMSLIKKTKFAERTDLVTRPSDLSLSVKKTESFLHKEIGDIDENIRKLYEQSKNGFSTLMQQL